MLGGALWWMWGCSWGQSQARCLGNTLQNRFLCITGDGGIFFPLAVAFSLAQRGEAHLAPQRLKSHQKTKQWAVSTLLCPLRSTFFPSPSFFCLPFPSCPCAPIHHGTAVSMAGAWSSGVKEWKESRHLQVARNIGGTVRLVYSRDLVFWPDYKMPTPLSL